MSKAAIVTSSLLFLLNNFLANAKFVGGAVPTFAQVNNFDKILVHDQPSEVAVLTSTVTADGLNTS